MDKAPIADYSGHPMLVLTLMDFIDFDTCSTGTQGCHIVKSARVWGLSGQLSEPFIHTLHGGKVVTSKYVDFVC